MRLTPALIVTTATLLFTSQAASAQMQGGAALSHQVTQQGTTNDDCLNCTAIIGPGTYTFDNLAASMDGAPDPLCDFFGTQDIDYDVWFCYTAASTTTAVVNTCSQTTVDTKIAVYAGGCGGPILACNDDTCALQSQVTFPVVAGNTYLLRLGTFPSASGGAGTFTVTENTGGGSGGDSCANATLFTGDGVFSVDNMNGTGLDANPGCSLCGGVVCFGNDVWYEWIPTVSGTVDMDMCDGTTNFDSALALWDGSGCPTSLISCNDDTCGQQSRIVAIVTAGNSYMIQLGGYNSAQGFGNLTILTTPPGAGNDHCSNPSPIAGDGVFVVDNTIGTGLDANPGCALANNDVWYAWTAAATGSVTMDLCDGTTIYDSALAAWDGPSGCPTNLLACNDDVCGLQSTIYFPVTAGTVYMIQVFGYNGATGSGNLTISTGAGITNDSCSNPEIIAGQGSFNYDNTTATLDGAGDPLCLKFGTDQIQQDVWFEWTADATGTATMETCNGGAHDTKIAAYDGAGCPTGSPLDCNDDTCGLQSQITFSVVSGNVYMLRLGSFSTTGGAGFFDLEIQGGGGGTCVDAVYCSSLPNSTGATAGLAWAGSCVVADNNFTLLASNGPGGQPGLFIYGANQASIPFGDGILCISAPIHRLNPPVFMDGSGAASKVVDLVNPPSTTGTITAGSTWNFQMWERDPAAGGAGYTFTDGLSVTFQ